jgi:hypothetical protein
MKLPNYRDTPSVEQPIRDRLKNRRLSHMDIVSRSLERGNPFLLLYKR